jgi:NADH:ubiquinone oxidoreductase subunit
VEQMIKQIFIWWERQTIGTLIKTLFFGKLVGKDKYGNKYYKNKKDQRWVIYSKSIEATKIPNNWYLWMHHTVNEIPSSDDQESRYFWQKDHQENLSGTSKAYTPLKINKKNKFKKYETWKN